MTAKTHSPLPSVSAQQLKIRSFIACVSLTHLHCTLVAQSATDAMLSQGTCQMPASSALQSYSVCLFIAAEEGSEPLASSSDLLSDDDAGTEAQATAVAAAALAVNAGDPAKALVDLLKVLESPPVNGPIVTGL